MPFNNPAGLFALLALIPFILLYLKQPKPKEKTIPSLMFFMRERSVTNFSNFFRHIVRNLLFLLQLAIILLAIFSAAEPYIMSDSATSSQHTGIVIDGSASMNALLAGESSTRFEKALREASRRASGETSVILAANIPVILFERGSESQARKVLSPLKPTATTTHIGDSMLTAGEILGDKPSSRVVVLSDFQANEGTDILVAKRALTARGIKVDLVNVLGSDHSGVSKLSNAGFVDLIVNKFQTTATVKNFDDVPRKVDVEVANNGKVIAEHQLDLEPRSLEPVAFETMHGSTTLSIIQEDDLPTDNELYVSSPVKKIKALLITNSDTSYLLAALKSLPNVQLDVAYPPVVRDFGYDVIVVHNASSSLMLPGFYRDINRAVSNGTGLIITAQDSLPTYAKQFRMPAEIAGKKNSSKASTKVENYLTKGVDFGVVSSYYSINPDSDGGFTALVTADDETPLIGTYKLDNGIVLYQGLQDDQSTFRSSYFYPVFWDNVMSFLTKSEDISSVNIPTGRVEAISEQQVSTPKGKLTTTRLYFDSAGFYSFDGKTVAANLLVQEESNIRSANSFQVSTEDEKLLTGKSSGKNEVPLARKLIAAAFALLLLELLIIKMRGDL